jgi:hypothetical protein
MPGIAAEPRRQRIGLIRMTIKTASASSWDSSALYGT